MLLRILRIWSAFSVITFLNVAVILAVVGVNAGFAIGLTYVDGNANPFSGAINLTGDTFTLATPAGIGDGHWDLRAFGAAGSVYDAGGAGSEVTCTGCTAEGAPEIMQTITGLNPGSSYDTYAVFWSSDGQNWMQLAGVASGVNTIYDRQGPVPAAPTAVAATYASSAVWDVPPPFPLAAGSTNFHEGDRSMLLGYAGTVVADGSGNAVVFLNDLPGSGGNRSFFDGVAYTAAGTPIALTATINRNAGSIVLNNPTSNNFQITSYSINSAAGSLNAAQWNTIHGHLDSGSSSFDTDLWNVVTPAPPALPEFNTVLTETEDASGAMSGGTITASGGTLSSINFGNAWQRTPYQDVTIALTLTDGTTVNVNPQYTGSAIAFGDFDAQSGINLTDFQTLLNNMQTNISNLTIAEAYQHGDMNADRLVNFRDFQAFRIAYDATHGAGSFDLTLAQVPEPGTLAAILMLGGILFAHARRRAVAVVLGLMLCVAANTSYAVPLLAVDIDDREGDFVAGPPGPNTVAGYTSFTLTGTTAGVANTTRTLGAYTVTVTSVNASGLAAGALDDRDRGTPTTAPTLNQLYDDVIFAGTSTGVGGGMNLEISGGGLLANSQYSVSVFAFDSGSGTPTRTANWLDGNDNNVVIVSPSFNGGESPTTDEQYKYTGLARTDATGKLILRGRSTIPTNVIGVFLNGFEVAVPVELTLEVNTTNGVVRFLNEQSVSFDMSYYEIGSAAGALNLAGWTSLDEGEMNDPLGTGWDEVPASSSNLLNEVNLQSMTTIAPSNSVGIGPAYNIGGLHDLRFYYAGPNDAALRQGLVKYVTGTPGVAGDYNANGVVDAADYVLWKNGGPLQNEVDTPGTVNAADYTAWRARFGNTSGSASRESAVPEPATGLLAIAMFGSVLATYRSRLRAKRSR